ncbi:PX domain-containing protein [Giardia muris]|uniref:PX domain-containing protein n=1 Tax=Giardia muris TaxID=5742 RepID=A0A4Z1T7M0_GIAMU|nr:PX domain-containing protein [Giardia muris]|eukprot:TNJ28569.1 PX domain-containing protein [Giardia muris]
MHASYDPAQVLFGFDAPAVGPSSSFQAAQPNLSLLTIEPPPRQVVAPKAVDSLLVLPPAIQPVAQASACPIPPQVVVPTVPMISTTPTVPTVPIVPTIPAQIQQQPVLQVQPVTPAPAPEPAKPDAVVGSFFGFDEVQPQSQLQSQSQTQQQPQQPQVPPSTVQPSQQEEVPTIQSVPHDPAVDQYIARIRELEDKVQLLQAQQERHRGSRGNVTFVEDTEVSPSFWARASDQQPLSEEEFQSLAKRYNKQQDYLQTRLYRDDYDQYQPSAKLRRYYDVTKPPKKPPSTIFKPYTDQQIDAQRNRVRSEQEAIRLQELLAQREHDRNLQRFYRDIERQHRVNAAVRDFTEDMIDARKQVFVQQAQALNRTANGSDLVLMLDINGERVLRFERSIFYGPDGVLKPEVVLASTVTSKNLYTNSDSLIYVFLISSKERVLKSVGKSYESIKQLHEDLCAGFGRLALPPFPDSALAGSANGRVEELTKDRVALEGYLRELNALKVVRTTRIYRDFLHHTECRLEFSFR